ncbi:RNA polymerase sigma-70 factor, ECF subfamily [Quadrisphaera granulorum]|uniref:RNA polymerase sigma-70 factor (ECF subfamily) n=1 Tax=Quadrisphaera granulorum TaxID=317664 RepID=A0A316A925_9ACTN|nr:RNA polymerase sigma-70 factor (ECF subfamily) [Quadrisphaera granulorum]SZE96386.1 RNA polymerase sigma-70 factor, ECF subfamily [Quadrisphaera granulorum]
MQEAQFDALHRTMADEVYRFAARRTSHATAEEVTAEVFMALWTGRHKIPEPPDEQRAWVFGVARRQLLRAQAAEERHRTIGARVRAALGVGAPVVEEDVALDVLETHAARRLWDQLPVRDQEVLALTAWEGLTPAQVAAVLGVSITAVTTRLHRARRHLADLQQSPHEDTAGDRS